MSTDFIPDTLNLPARDSKKFRAQMSLFKTVRVIVVAVVTMSITYTWIRISIDEMRRARTQLSIARF